MKTPAIIASLTVVGSLAVAASKQDGSQTPSRGTARFAATNLAVGEVGRNTAIADTTAAVGCAGITEQTWFAPSPQVVPCAGLLGPNIDTLYTQHWRMADINGDHKTDHLRGVPGVSESAYVLYQGSPTPDASNMAIILETLGGDQSVTLSRVRLFSPDFDLHGWCSMNLPAPTEGLLRFSLNGDGGVAGWRDMDEDGDLDLVVFATDLYWVRQIWLENIGYEKPAPPLAADINRDGRVDGADLGMVLVSWGTNP
jgi:hypothetical protein